MTAHDFFTPEGSGAKKKTHSIPPSFCSPLQPRPRVCECCWFCTGDQDRDISGGLDLMCIWQGHDVFFDTWFHDFNNGSNKCLAGISPAFLLGIGGIKTSIYLHLLSVWGRINTHSSKPRDHLLRSLTYSPSQLRRALTIKVHSPICRSSKKAGHASAPGTSGIQVCEVARPVSQWSWVWSCQQYHVGQIALSSYEVRWDLPAVCNCYPTLHLACSYYIMLFFFLVTWWLFSKVIE